MNEKLAWNVCMGSRFSIPANFDSDTGKNTICFRIFIFHNILYWWKWPVTPFSGTEETEKSDKKVFRLWRENFHFGIENSNAYDKKYLVTVVIEFGSLSFSIKLKKCLSELNRTFEHFEITTIKLLSKLKTENW